MRSRSSAPTGTATLRAFADDAPIGDPATELVTRDHYLLRMLYSQGVPLEALGVSPRDGSPAESDGRRIWRTFAEHIHLFRGTPSKLWLDHTLAEVFGVEKPLEADTADAIYDHLVARLADDAFRPRALYERFGIEFLATTDAATDELEAHARLRDSGWSGRVVPTFRPDDVVDPDRPDFRANLDRLADLTGEDTTTWAGYLAALRARRQAFVAAGATASDHGHPTAMTADLPAGDAEALFARVRQGPPEPGRRRALPGPDAHRDGGDEPRRRSRPPAPRRLVAGPQPVAHRPVRSGPGGGHPEAHGLRRGAQAAARPVRQRARPDRGRLHAGREHLQPRARPAGRPLSRPPAGASMVVPRQPRGHSAVPLSW